MAEDTNMDNAGTQLPNQEPQKFTVSGQEYSQDELDRLVGLGKIGLEAEEKYNVKLDRVWPNLQSTINEKQRLERELEETKKSFHQTPVTPSAEQLTQEQIKEQARQLGLVTKEDFAQYYKEIRQQEQAEADGRALIEDINEVINQQKSDGHPATTVDDMLQYMAENGVRNPQSAYKLMFESELDKIKEQKLGSLKQPGLTTLSGSTAGSKEPAPQKITDANLNDAIKAALNGQF